MSIFLDEDIFCFGVFIVNYSMMTTMTLKERLKIVCVLWIFWSERRGIKRYIQEQWKKSSCMKQVIKVLLAIFFHLDSLPIFHGFKRVMLEGWGRILGRYWDRSLKNFFLAIHSHFYYKNSPPHPLLSKGGLKLVCNVNIVYDETSSLRNLNIMPRNLNEIVRSWIRLLV